MKTGAPGYAGTARPCFLFLIGGNMVDMSKGIARLNSLENDKLLEALDK